MSVPCAATRAREMPERGFCRGPRDRSRVTNRLELSHQTSPVARRYPTPGGAGASPRGPPERRPPCPHLHPTFDRPLAGAPRRRSRLFAARPVLLLVFRDHVVSHADLL